MGDKRSWNNFIEKAIKKPVAPHKQLSEVEDKKIPPKKLTAAAKKGSKLGKRARIAQTSAKLKKHN